MSVKVAVRSRPLSENEVRENAGIILKMNGNEVDLVDSLEGSGKSFVFDHAFWSSNVSVDGSTNPEASQETIYSALGEEILNHTLTGYNACVFAYGQTGSGKTYCMMGTEEAPGLVPRIADALFKEAHKLSNNECEVCVEVSYFEIYNEKVRCLLRPTSEGFENNLRVREHPKFGPFIEGLAKFVVTTQAEFLQLMKDGNKVRTTASTMMNATSSRSHAVFSITLTQKKKRGTLVSTTTSKLNLVDLAGSERASKTMASGKRLAEGANINKSLTCLGNVISALAEIEEKGKARHVPYRDSTLTWILKENLGGNSKTIMLATISPSSAQFEETMSTLRYAERAKHIVNKAVINETNNNELIAALQREIENLKKQLQNASVSERERLQEEIDASEAVKKELNSSLEDKLRETKKMMEERETYMKQLKAKLDEQEQEINKLKEENDEKEKRIAALLKQIESIASTKNNNPQVDLIREQVAALESEQIRTESHIKGRMKPRQRDAVDDVDFDSSVSSGSALRGESSQVVQSTAPLSIVSQSQANINPDEIELEDINFDDLSVDSGLELDSASDGEQLEFDEDILLDENSRHSSGTPLEVDEDLLLESEEDVAEPNVAEEESAPAERPPEPPTMLSEKVLGKASLTKEMSQLDDFSHPSGKRPEIFQPSKSAPTVVIPSHALPHNFCLRESFKVVKMKDAVVGAKKDRIWEVDVLRKKFCNYDMHGKKTFEQLATNLYRVEKGDGNSKRLTLYFFDAPHPYEFEFASSARRQLFYELAMLLRRNSILWCPSLCVGGENDAIINIKGTTIDRVTGPPVRVDGECQFSVGRMPYEVINFWYGCFSLDGKDLPRNDAVLGSFIPKESHEIYIIGVTDIPSHLVGSDEIGRYFLAYIGSASYFVLESTAVKAKKKSVNNAIVIICRRSFIVRVCHVEAAELSPVYKDNMARSDFTAVGCALHINEASIGVVLVNFKRNKCTVETRTACLRTLLSAFPFGPLSVDIHVRFDYLIVSGSFGFDGSFSEQDVLQYQMSTDNLMSDMSEGVPSTPLKTAENPMRIFVRTNPKVCRFDVQQYSTSRALSSSNAYIIGDVFCRRTFLSTFGESAPPVQLILNEFQLSGDRYPYVSNPTLYLYGDWFENSPLTFQLVPRKQNVFQVAPNCEPILYPCVCSREFLRVQTLTFSIFGQVGTRQGGSPTLIGSGALPLKGTTVLGESAPFQVPFYFHGCRVGKVNGTVLTVLYEKNVLGGEGYSNERFLASASVYENQVRKTNRWEAANFSRDGIYEWSSLNTTTECVRDAFLLPSASWSWLSEWKLDLNHTSEGWLYGTLASENYSLRESSNASFRRRKWYRVMRADNPLALHEYLLHKSEQAKEASQ